MRQYRWVTVVAVLLGSALAARAGLYYSGENIAELPSQWRGFLLDQRLLRRAAVKPADNAPNPLRAKYQDAVAKLEKLAGDRKLSADECADLGALYIRLGEVNKAVDVLRKAQRDFEKQFKIVANLGTAWQLAGDYEQARAALEEAVKLAPPGKQKLEQLQLRLVKLRQNEDKNADSLDDLFGVHYGVDHDKYEAGKIVESEGKKLPEDAAAELQQLCLWLPADGRLLWQLGELANALGDVQTAAAILDGCVGEFGMRATELRSHRQVLRTAADELGKLNPGDKTQHERHAAGLKAKSPRPLPQHIDEGALAEIKPKGLNDLPWTVLADTKLDRKLKPTFPKYLRDLDGKRVTLVGYMQPLGTDLDCASFLLIENPVGCWYCEMPEMTGMLQVEMPSGSTFAYTHNRIRIEGTLTLNALDAENFLFTVINAKVEDDD
jgi:hypothetical protein